MHASIVDPIQAFYEQRPYPPPVDDLDAYRRSWNDERRRTEFHVLWPALPYRDDRSILVAGCGTTQAAHYALRWPRARVVAIDISARSIAFTEELKRTHALDNLEVHELAVERVGDLRETFDHIVCTGVLHHLAEPDAGLRALRDVLAPAGALTVMLYAPYGRAGVYMIAEYARRLGIGTTDADIRDLVVALRDLPPDHALVPLLRSSPDFADPAGVADALLNPRDQAYAVPQIFDLLQRGGCSFGRWTRQAPYLPWCGSLATSPHHDRLAALPPGEAFAAIELFRGTFARHSFIAYRSPEAASAAQVRFDAENWLAYRPIRLPETVTVRDRVPPGAAAVLINRRHTFTDLYLPIDAQADRLVAAIDGRRSIAEIARDAADRAISRDLFERLVRWDQIVVDAS